MWLQKDVKKKEKKEHTVGGQCGINVERKRDYLVRWERSCDETRWLKKHKSEFTAAGCSFTGDYGRSNCFESCHLRNVAKQQKLREVAAKKQE